MIATSSARTTDSLRGGPLAKQFKEAIAQEVKNLAMRSVMPRVATIFAPGDLSTQAYVESKRKMAASLGIQMDLIEIGTETTQAQLRDICSRLSNESNVHGILLELPLPKPLDPVNALKWIDPKKDIDGLTPTNMGLIAAGREGEALCAATARACIALIESRFSLRGKRVAIIGRGATVGRPLMGMLVNRDATITVCHTKTPSLSEATSGADVVIVAIGRPKEITATDLHPGQVLIDAGINVIEEKVIGDIDAESVEGLADALTPVPGGVGPLTSAIIFDNLLKAIRLQDSIN